MDFILNSTVANSSNSAPNKIEVVDSNNDNDHLGRRNQYKKFYSSLSVEDLVAEASLQKVQASMCDTWSEIRKDSSRSLRALVQEAGPEIVADDLFSTFLQPLSEAHTSHGTGGLSGQCWQHVHGNLLGVFALLPLLVQPLLGTNSMDCRVDNVSSSSSPPSSTTRRVECVKKACLEALSHPQLPVREVARSCLHDLSRHVGSLGKTFLGKCLERIGLQAESDVSEKTEVHASELDGLLHYVGRMVSAEGSLLRGCLADGSGATNDGAGEPMRMVPAVLTQLHLCMQHPSSTVRQRAAYVFIECVSCSSGRGSIGDGGSVELEGQAEFLHLTVDTVIAVLSKRDEDWRVTEGYMLVTESLLQQLLVATVATLRRGLGLDSGEFGAQGGASCSDVQADLLRLVDPLIRHARELTRHSSFEVRRIASQLMPSLARAVLLTPREECAPLKELLCPRNDTPQDEDGVASTHIGEKLPLVVFANELWRGVAFLQELQRERACEERSLFPVEPPSPFPSPSCRDPAKMICEPYNDWVRQTRRRTGEEEKQKHFFNMVSSLSHTRSSSTDKGDVLQSLLVAGLNYVSATIETVNSLETDLFSAGVVALDVLECGVLTAATSPAPRSAAPIGTTCRWLRCLGYLQLEAYAKSRSQHAAALRALISLSVDPAEQSKTFSFLSSISDPAVDPSLSNVVVSADGRAWALTRAGARKKLMKNEPHALDVMNKTLLEAIYPTIPGLLHCFSLSDLVLCALLYSQWSHCLMSESYWQLGWGSRPSSKRNILETLQAGVMVMEVRMASLTTDTIPPESHIHCFAEAMTSIISSLATSFVTCSVHEEAQLGTKAKFDLKVALVTLEICLQLMKSVSRYVPISVAQGKDREGSKPHIDDDTGGWQEDVMRLCAFVAARLSSDPASTMTPPPSPPKSGSSDDVQLDVVVGPEVNMSDDEFSDWDDSDEEEGDSVKGSPMGEQRARSGSLSGAVRRSSFRQHSGNTSSSCFDTILIRNNMQEIEAMLAL